MKTRTRNIVVAATAGIAVLAVAAVVIGRVTVEAGMPGIAKMIADNNVPGAVRMLESEYQFDNPVGLNALHQFAVLVLRQSLNQPDPFERCYVATSLVGNGDWSGRGAIDKALNSSNFLVQKAAIEGLAEAGTPEAIEVIERFYQSSGQDGQLMAIQGLSEIRSPIVKPLLIAAAKDPNSNLIVWSVNGLGHLGDPTALPYLRNVLAKSTDPMVRTETAHSIILLGDSSGDMVAIIVKGLDTNNVQQASEAALALGDVKADNVVPTLKQYETNERVNQRVRLAAAVALTNHNNSDGLPLLKSALIDEDSDRYLPPLLDHLDFTLGRPLLVGALSSSNQVLRLAATEAIGRKGGVPEIVLLEQSTDKIDDPIEMAQVAWSLGRIGRPECIPILLKMVQSPAPEVRDTAADALARTAAKLLGAKGQKFNSEG